jgi:hypothetical protein
MRHLLLKRQLVLSGTVIGLALSIFALLSINSGFPAQAQTDCSGYYQCQSLQSTSQFQVRGEIKYWFDDFRIPSTIAEDFKRKINEAAADWSSRTGVAIREVPRETGKVRIYLSGVDSIERVNGKVDADQTYVGNVQMVFSRDEWSTWADVGKDWIASHEWGHVIAFEEVAPNACSTVQTIMRQGDIDPATFDKQLKPGGTLPGPRAPHRLRYLCR